jgi:hypothetical protein
MTHRYFKVSPRGFANEVVYFRVPEEKAPEVDAYFATYEDDEPWRYATWTNDEQARVSGVAVEWDDRAHIGFA